MYTITHDHEKMLADYLKCEASLREFFNTADYCKDNCWTQEKGKWYGRGYVGCCDANHFIVSELPEQCVELLFRRRHEKYGKPTNEFLSNCYYHTRSGCKLSDHKSPICISFACRPLKEHLLEQYGITYDSFKVQRFLEDILWGDAAQNDIMMFDGLLNRWISAINAKKDQKTPREMQAGVTE